jgi:hypothetical protein
MSLHEIACATGVELAAVKSRLNRARENLRAHAGAIAANERGGLMDPLDDPKLSELLKEWQVLGATPSLDARVLRRDRWWSVLLTGSIRVPVPVGILIAAILLVMAVALVRRPGKVPQSTVNLVDFRPVDDPHVRVIRGQL